MRSQQIIDECIRTDHIDPTKQRLNKHVKMAENPFRFLRGSSGLFYADIARGTLQFPPALLQVPLTTVTGDCHLANFGFFSEEGSYGDRVKFGPNDFDDACIGHAVWDLSRFMISVLLAADYCRGLVDGRYPQTEALDAKGLRAATEQDALAGTMAFLQGYRRACQNVAADPETRFTILDDFPKQHVLKPFLKKAIKRCAAGTDFFSKSSLAKSVDLTQRPLQFKQDANKFTRLSAERYQQIADAFAPYVHDSILDIVTRQGAGTGSLNMQRYYLLVGPAHIQQDDDLRLCQLVEVKQQRRSAPLAFFADLSPVNRLNDAHLTVDCQRLMQRRPDLVLDEVLFEGAHYLVRSLHHANVDVDPEDICLHAKPARALAEFGDACGYTLGLAHNSADRRSNRFALQMLDALSADGCKALQEVCLQYAAVQQQDCQLLAAMLPAA